MDGMMAMDEVKQFSTRDAARILNATEARVRSLAKIGGVDPRAGRGERPQFSFQELLLLRTTNGLLDAGIPPQRVKRVWSSLRRQLEADLPLTSVRILADGNRAVAWHENAAWQPDSGQFLLHFDSADIDAPAPSVEGVECAERVESVMGVEGVTGARPSDVLEPPKVGLVPAAVERPVDRALERSRKPRRADPPTASPEQWFHIACELEDASPIEARHAYLLALDGDPDYADVHINLGRLYHEDHELPAAERHYREAIRCEPDEFIGHFNLAVLLEDLGREDEAVRTYRRALALDPDSADAHYNLGLLLESCGRRDEAMRHYMNARRLSKPAGGKRGNP